MTTTSLIFRPLRVAASLALCGISSMAAAAPPDMTAGWSAAKPK